MKSTLSFVLIALVIFSIPVSSNAQSDKPIQIALFKPIQLFSAGTSITGLRINIIYGVNNNVTGLDFGLVNKLTGNMTGIQYGLYNYSNTMNGLQLGVVNNTGMLKGLQIGLININKSGDPFTFLPIVNFSF